MNKLLLSLLYRADALPTFNNPKRMAWSNHRAHLARFSPRWNDAGGCMCINLVESPLFAMGFPCTDDRYWVLREAFYM